MTSLSKISFVCLDGEFTGLDSDNDRVIELAAVRFTLTDIEEDWQTLIDPLYPISPEAQKIHHITDDMVRGKPKIFEVLPTLQAFIGDSYIVGHAIFHDIQMLKKEAERYQVDFQIKTDKVIDTLRLARSYGDSPNNSLQALATHFNLEVGKSHRAMDDVLLNVGLFRHLMRRFKTLKDVQNLLSRPIQMKYMPLGKYKARLFSEIPLAYLKWAVTMDFDDDLLYSIKLELKKRKQGDGFSHATNPFSQL
jgi:DNA polymerase-3 subunit epsilon